MIKKISILFFLSFFFFKTNTSESFISRTLLEFKNPMAICAVMLSSSRLISSELQQHISFREMNTKSPIFVLRVATAILLYQLLKCYKSYNKLLNLNIKTSILNKKASISLSFLFAFIVFIKRFSGRFFDIFENYLTYKLHKAIEENNLSKIKILIYLGANIHLRIRHEALGITSALNLAVKLNNLEIVSYLSTWYQKWFKSVHSSIYLDYCSTAYSLERTLMPEIIKLFLKKPNLKLFELINPEINNDISENTEIKILNILYKRLFLFFENLQRLTRANVNKDAISYIVYTFRYVYDWDYDEDRNIKFERSYEETIKQLFEEHNEKIIIDLENEESEQCNICFEKESNELFKTKCKHCFHINCLSNWFKEKVICPACNSKELISK